MSEPNNKMKLWNDLGVTDPKHVKPFQRSGGFRGSAIKPMWSYKRMTETFGAIGFGWGNTVPQFQVVPAGDELMVYCTVGVWVGSPSQPFYGVGGDKVISKTKNGLNTSDEAFKAAFTDAMTNALKLLGVGADVHMGLYDDVKYLREAEASFDDEGNRIPEDQRPAPRPKLITKAQADSLRELVKKRGLTTDMVLGGLKQFGLRNMAEVEVDRFDEIKSFFEGV